MGKTALITGASSGLGKDFAELFAADGHDVILVARRRERLEEVAAEIRGRHDVQCYVEPADLSRREAPQELFDRLQEQNIPVDFLVNNAGFGSNGTFWELPIDGELDQIRVNMEALVHLTHLFLPAMVERKFGRVLNIASTAGFQAGPYMSVYYATKAFVISFTEGIAHELRGTGVTATAHCPGATATEFSAVSGNDKSALFQKGAIASSMEVATHAYHAMNAGKVVTVFGAMNSIGAFSVRFSPRGVLRSIAAKVNSPP